MDLQLVCPCGVAIVAPEADLVALVQEHLAAEHPGREYTDEQILFLATPA